ncbi:MAG: isoamylase [Treponema sp.]|nr:isoamylase [Treponema sp.]
MKKNKFLIASFIIALFSSFGQLFAAEEINYQPYELDKLIHEIEKPCGPVVTEDYIIFTAAPTSRYVGIAFDFENYQVVHPFKLFSSIDEEGNKTPRYLFYCYERHHKISEISYRLVIDGLWTVDPLNPKKYYDDDINLYFSKVEDPGSIKVYTQVTSDDKVKFIYKGKSGEKIRLAGTFCNWDSWIYELKETAPGFYELTLPLPTGKYYYNYYVGLTPIVDSTNPEKAFTKDGRSVSVIEVK